MKKAFSTLGCPGWSLSDICATAGDLQFDGIELRGLLDFIDITKSPYFSDDKLDNTLKKIAKAKLTVPMLTSGAVLGTADNGSAADEARRFIDLAAKIGVPYVRVMITGNPHYEQADLAAAECAYRGLCEYAADKGVTPLIETNGPFCDTKVLADFLKAVNHPNSGVLWDVHHPYRYLGETPEQTMANIGSAVKYVHVKDSVMQNGAVSYRMMGYGDVPFARALELLKTSVYEGYVSLEWTKRWLNDLEEPGIVFSHYASVIDEYL